MKKQDFQDLLDTYGGNPQDWPESQRPDALALLQQDNIAVQMHEEAMALDLMLSGEPIPKPDAGAMERLFDDVARHASAEAHRQKTIHLPVHAPAKPSFAQKLLSGVLRPGLALGASAAMGVVFGVWDVWLAPVQSPDLVAEFVFSALPL